MKCPYCSFVSFEHLESCRKCSKDLTSHKSQFGIDFLEPLALGSMAFAIGSASSAATSSNDDSGDVGFESDDFSFGGLSDDSASDSQDDDGAIEIGTEEAIEAEMAVDGASEFDVAVEEDEATPADDEEITIDLEDDTTAEESSADIGFDLADEPGDESQVDTEPPPIPTEDSTDKPGVAENIDDEISLDFGDESDEEIDLGVTTEETGDSGDDEISLDFGDESDDGGINLDLGDDSIDEAPDVADDIAIDTADEEITIDIDDAPASEEVDPLAMTDLGLDGDIAGLDDIPELGEAPTSDALGGIDTNEDEFDMTAGDDALDESTLFGVDIDDEGDGVPSQMETIKVDDEEDGIEKDVEISLDEFDNMNLGDDEIVGDKIDLSDDAFADKDSEIDITFSMGEDTSSDSGADNLLDFGDDDIGDSDITLEDESSSDKINLDDSGDEGDFLGEFDFDIDENDDDKG